MTMMYFFYATVDFVLTTRSCKKAGVAKLGQHLLLAAAFSLNGSGRVRMRTNACVCIRMHPNGVILVLGRN